MMNLNDDDFFSSDSDYSCPLPFSLPLPLPPSNNEFEDLENNMGNISTTPQFLNENNKLKNKSNDKPIEYNDFFKTQINKLKDKEDNEEFLNKFLNEEIIKKSQKQELRKISLPPPPTQYTTENIKDILSKLNIDDKIKKSFKIDDNILNIEKYISNESYFSIKRRKPKTKRKEIKDKKKLGRKRKDDTTQNGIHTKDSLDNIVKKIKVKILDYLILFINNILNNSPSDNNNKISSMKFMINKKEPKSKDLIKNLDYNNIVNNTKKEDNLKFLKMTLGEFLSQKISKKYKTLPADYNKTIIEKIIIKENNNEIITFIFNTLTLGDWIDIFIYKKELNDIHRYIGQDKINIIMNKFVRANKLIEDIYNLKSKNNYFSCFLIILYNYERWFFIKKERQKLNKID